MEVKPGDIVRVGEQARDDVLVARNNQSLIGVVLGKAHNNHNDDPCYNVKWSTEKSIPERWWVGFLETVFRQLSIFK